MNNKKPSASQNKTALRALWDLLGLHELSPRDRVDWYRRFNAARLAGRVHAENTLGVIL